jgi:23S rRNA (adenine2030-N6)-methyltransferase
MNYSHAFHAGNFADIVKHAALLALLGRLQADPAPLALIDTHGGRGVYDLDAPEARRSAEAERGIARLIEDPAPPEAVGRLKSAVLAASQAAGGRRYPGSPLLAAQRLRPQDRLTVFEFNPREAEVLKASLAGVGAGAVSIETADGYDGAVRHLAPDGRALVLIDPPFERGDDYDRCLATLQAMTRRNLKAAIMIWLPLKDLETFDAFVRRAEEIRPVRVAEVRLRPLLDPMRMNGCALVLAAAPEGLDLDLAAICEWTASRLGEGGGSRLWGSA